MSPKLHGSHADSQVHIMVSGLRMPDREGWRAGLNVLAHFDHCLDCYLERWAWRMRHAGYLSFTTAKRADCIASMHAFVDPILGHADLPMPPTFEFLRENGDGWANMLLASGLRHCQRGIAPVMFLGCFKTFVQALVDALMQLPDLGLGISRGDVKQARQLLALYEDAFDLLWLGAVIDSQHAPDKADRDEVLRQLTVQKCRMENLLNSTPDGVLVMDDVCRIRSANAMLRKSSGMDVIGRPVWEVLKFEDIRTPGQFFQSFREGETIDLGLFDDGQIFRVSLVALANVSLASSREYMLLFTNITPHVKKEEMLERSIQEHLKALHEEKRKLEEMNITLRNVLQNVRAEGARQSQADSQMRNGSEMGKLTLAELKVCQMVQAGKSSKEIAATLGISTVTVQTHRRNIRRKLDVRGRRQQLAMHLIRLNEQTE